MMTIFPVSTSLTGWTAVVCLIHIVQGFQKDFEKYGEKDAQIVGVSVDSVDKVSFV